MAWEQRKKDPLKEIPVWQQMTMPGWVNVDEIIAMDEHNKFAAQRANKRNNRK